MTSSGCSPASPRSVARPPRPSHDAGRTEQAEKERAEAVVIADYLPEQLTEDEIDELVSDTIDELGVREDGMRAMGRVMGALGPKTKGRADGGVVAAAVRAQLGGWCLNRLAQPTDDG